ncbi:MAG TPA: prolyl aminopeptidase [Methylophilaceae bacterium]|jgi:proline iminopeptidase|nr:prolyl aminopeptidase [Methylophilaceae bacterium]
MHNPDTLLHPALEPFQQAMLNVSPLHSIYYEQCGNPAGFPVVVLHGGPGSGCTPMQRRFFDPNIYRIVLFDQRGCKRSQPLGDTNENTTQHLITDIEALRTHLGITRWMVFGGSWGSTLALAYAQSHPEAVNELILRGIFLCRPHELDWFFYEVRHFFPDAWNKFAEFLPKDERDDIFSAYWGRIFSDDTTLALSAAACWSNFEAEIMSLLPAATNVPSIPTDEAAIIGRARVQLHYLANNGFIDGDETLARIDIIRHIPTKIIQGRYDMVCPPCTAYELHQAWPEAEFTMVHDAGHSAMEPGIIKALMEAASSFHPR